MKAPQYRPTAKELIDDFGAVPYPGKQNADVVGLIVHDRILWVNAKDVLVAEENLSNAILRARERKFCQLSEPVVEISYIPEPYDPPEFKVPSDDYIKDDEIAHADVPDIPSPMVFDMGRASDDRDGLPEFVRNVVGLATGRAVGEEW